MSCHFEVRSLAPPGLVASMIKVPHPAGIHDKGFRFRIQRPVQWLYMCVFRDEQRKECFKVRDSNKSLKAGFNWSQRKKNWKIENPNLIMIIRDNLNYEPPSNRCTNLIIRFDLSTNQKTRGGFLFESSIATGDEWIYIESSPCNIKHSTRHQVYLGSDLRLRC